MWAVDVFMWSIFEDAEALRDGLMCERLRERSPTRYMLSLAAIDHLWDPSHLS